MKGFVISVLIAACALAAAAQASSDARSLEPCTLTVQNSPTIRGLHLGMTASEMFGQFPGSSVDAGLRAVLISTDDHFGKSGVEIPRKYIPESMSSAVEYIYVELFDDHVAGFIIHYKGPRWRSVNEFTAKLSESFGLPRAGDWQGSGDSSRSLTCNGFRIDATGSANYTSIYLRDMSSLRTDEDRKAEADEKARREFKP